MNSVRKIAALLAVALLVGSLGIPAQGNETYFCRHCNNFTGLCDYEGPLKDRCYQGWYGGEPFCAAWGGLLNCEEPESPPVGLDGTIVDASAKLAIGKSGTEYQRNCRGYVVARSYTARTAELMRERTHTVTI